MRSRRPHDSPHRQLRLLRPQPRAVRSRARWRRGRAPQRRGDARRDRDARPEPHHPLARSVLAGRGRASRPTSCGASVRRSRFSVCASATSASARRTAATSCAPDARVHGRTSPVTHDGSSIFTGLPSPLRVARYHSLVIARASLPRSLRVTASASDDGEIMAVEHRAHPRGRRAVPSRVGGERIWLRDARPLHARRACAPDELPIGADGVDMPPLMSQRDAACGAFAPPGGAGAVTVAPRSQAEPVIAASTPGDVLPALWVNGERQSSAGPHVSARDRGFTLADGVFETMRAQGGTVFRLDRHLARLVQALAALDIPAPPELRRMGARCGTAPPAGARPRPSHRDSRRRHGGRRAARRRAADGRSSP